MTLCVGDTVRFGDSVSDCAYLVTQCGIVTDLFESVLFRTSKFGDSFSHCDCQIW